ncbi:YadA-like family protein [Megasphaera elsdenii]|uniref:YadA-like family protein n=1 Tax=Megasphaera elsdenii TaxID=907 RepID=UPI000AFCA30D|nr:YadA-like family protein [Megasphaera elsdenii]
MAYSPVLAADNTAVTDSNGNTVTNTDKNIKDINANITGKNNKVIDSSNAEIVGDGNKVTNEAKGDDNSVRYVRSDDARIHGSGNIISASRNQQVIGDNNQIIGRDDGTVTDYQHPEGREPNVSDLTIGRGNFIRSTDTYRNEWDSLKVIGNNNRADFKIESAGGPAAGIVIGDNQNIDGINESIVIGSLSPTEQQLSPSGKPKEKGEIDDLYSVGSNSIIIGYHTKIKQYGEGIVVGNRSQGIGIYETIMGSRSIIGNDTSDLDSGSGAIASIYGAFNKIEDAAGGSAESASDVDGIGNSINGSLNITSSARGTMIMGVGNTVTHAKGPDILGKDENTPGATGYWVSSGLYGASYYAQGADTVDEGNNLNISFDEMRNSWQKYMETSGGAVSVFGNSNDVDYAIRSQILGTGNTINGSEKNVSAYNTVSGFANTGTNIKRSAIVGTGNTLKNGEDNVVIGDYHNLENGKHNVILGSMDSTEKQVTKQSKSAWARTYEHPDGTFEYTVTEQVPVKDHTKDIENAVMVGYNTDATVDGGVALGSDSVASTKAGETGYDALGKKHSNSDTDYSAWVSTDAAVSVGGADREVKYKDKEGKEQTNTVKSTRQITNLAAGKEDTDAVNVAQMKVTATAAADAVKTHFYSVNSQDASAGNYNNNGATGKDAIAAGVGASSDGDSSIAVGTNSRVASNGYSLTSIAIGKNAYVLNGTGQQEFQLSFDKGNWNQIFGYSTGPKDISRIPGGIAIGTNSYARTGSVQIGAHTYTGKMGNMDVTDKTNSEANIVDMTTIGSNTYNRGALATMVGAYSIITGDFDGSGSNSYSTGTQNFGANVIGSLNSIRTKGYSGTSGVANSIVGIANIAENANGALIYGAGNQISNSIRPITSIDVTKGSSTVDGMVDSLRNAVQKQEGGATLAIGGGNTANWTQASQLMGVDNTLTGTETSVSEYSLIDGYKNTVSHVKHATIIGSENNVSGEEKDNVEGLILLGDNRNVWKQADHSVVIGSSDDTGHSYVTRPDEVIIGHNAYVENHGGNTSGNGDVAIGHNSFIENYVNQSGSIALGQNTHIRNSTGSTENAFILNQYETTQDGSGVTIPTDVAKMNGSIAIGENTFARTGSLMIGTHKYTGEIGDTKVDTSDATSMAKANQQINETVLGTNSFSLGAFSTVTGAYSIISGDYDNGKWRNFGSSITGSLNSIESKTATTADAGNASHIIGTANRMQNANGAVVIGSGNEITDSYATMSMPTSNNTSAKDLSEKIRKSIKTNGGGAAAIVGNGNEVKKSTNVAVMGSKNSVTSTTNSQIFGDNRTVTGADGAAIDGAVIIGSADPKAPLTTNKKNVTILGYNANATVEGGVALGAGSVASVDLGEKGYDPAQDDHSKDDTGTWISKAAAVSVGDASKKITRQITNVAAGTQNTDAVNVAQLKNLQTTINGDVAKAVTEVKGDKNVKVTPSTAEGDGHTIYTLALSDTVTIGSNKSVKIDGTNGEVSGLSNTTWDKNVDYSNSTKAATEAQIQQAMKDVQDAAKASDMDTHVKAGTYAVDADHQVSMNIVDKDGKNTGYTVKITDVAKASDIGDVSKFNKEVQNNGGSTTVVDAINNVNTRVDTVDTKVGDLQYVAEGKAKVVANNDSVTTAIGKLDQAIGNAATEAGKHTVVSTEDANLTVKNIAKSGEAANYQLALNKDIKVDSVTATKVTSDTVNTKNLSVSDVASIGDVTINKGGQGTVDGLKNTAWDAKNITSGRAATEDQVKAATKNAVNYDGDDSKTVTLREDTTINNVANTTIEKGSKNAVNAGTVYKETRVGKDGIFIRQANTAGENITALDHQVAANTESIYHINNRVSNLDNRVNKVGAGAAALAALHPLDFDPDDKWDFAVGYGNYRNANSVALGAFYRPNEDTIFSLGTNFGNGENMFNAGLSFKIGQGGSGITTSKTAMAKKIESLENTVDQQDKKIAELEALVKEQGEMIRQYVGKK